MCHHCTTTVACTSHQRAATVPYCSAQPLCYYCSATLVPLLCVLPLSLLVPIESPCSTPVLPPCSTSVLLLCHNLHPLCQTVCVANLRSTSVLPLCHNLQQLCHPVPTLCSLGVPLLCYRYHCATPCNRCAQCCGTVTIFYSSGSYF
jgi:hypothetical protein